MIWFCFDRKCYEKKFNQFFQIIFSYNILYYRLKFYFNLIVRVYGSYYFLIWFQTLIECTNDYDFRKNWKFKIKSMNQNDF